MCFERSGSLHACAACACPLRHEITRKAQNAQCGGMFTIRDYLRMMSVQSLSRNGGDSNGAKITCVGSSSAVCELVGHSQSMIGRGAHVVIFLKDESQN